MSDEIRVDGHTIRITNGDKVLFPQGGITKRALVEYYLQIADTMLPHLRERPLTMLRYPEGINGQRFFQKSAPDYFPKWIKRVRVEKAGGFVNHVVCNDAATLVYLANLACITPHIWTSRRNNQKRPDLIVFDLDPPDGKFAEVRFAASRLRDQLKDLGLVPFVQTTGSRGLHVVAPIVPDADFDEIRQLVGTVADSQAQAEPHILTTEYRKAKRGKRVFIDTGRNAYAQTFVSPYGVRPLPSAPIATPIEWDEIDGVEPQMYNIGNIFERLKRKGDAWRDIMKSARPLDIARRKIKEHSLHV